MNNDRFKFRAWDGEVMMDNLDSINLEMLHRQLLTDDGEKFYPVTIMQSTGQKDKNGKLIFEGDIIKWTTTFNETSNAIHKDVMTWDNATACYLLMPWCHEPHGADMEIIGDKYTTPELLEAF